MPNKKHVYIYHHNDADGNISAGIIMNSLRSRPDYTDAQIKTFPKSYTDDFNEHICADSETAEVELYFLDLSFTEQSRHKLDEAIEFRCARLRRIVWIDHHIMSKPVAESYARVSNNLGGNNQHEFTIIFDSKICGACLCYIYHSIWSQQRHRFNSSLVDGIEVAIDTDQKNISCYVRSIDCTVSIPELLYHLDAHDRKTRADVDCDAFMAGLQALGGWKLKDDNHLFDDMSSLTSSSYAQTCINTGKIVVGYRRECFEIESSRIYQKQIFGGINVAFKNALGNSDNFLDLLEKNQVDCAIIGAYNPTSKLWNYTIYGNRNLTMKVNGIAGGFGGGGHPGASGFNLKECLFALNVDALEILIETCYPKAAEAFRQYSKIAYTPHEIQKSVTIPLTEPKEEVKTEEQPAEPVKTPVPEQFEPVKNKVVFLGGTQYFSDIDRDVYTYRDLVRDYINPVKYIDPTDASFSTSKARADAIASATHFIAVIYPVNTRDNTQFIIEAASRLFALDDKTMIFFVDGFDGSASYLYKMDTWLSGIYDSLVFRAPSKVRKVTPSELYFELGEYFAELEKNPG